MKSTTKTVITIAIIAALSAALDLFAVIGLPTGIFSVSSFYLSAAFYMLFVYLWKWKGVVSVYVGMILASLFSGFSLFPLYGAWGNTLAAVLIVYGMKVLKRNIELKSVKDYAAIVILYVLASALSGLWVIGGWVVVGILPSEAFQGALFTWWFGDVVVYLILGTLLMKFVAPLLKRFHLE